jgi:hypothetical protein
VIPPVQGGQGRTDQDVQDQADGLIRAAKSIGWFTIALTALNAVAVIGGVL